MRRDDPSRKRQLRAYILAEGGQIGEGVLLMDGDTKIQGKQCPSLTFLREREGARRRGGLIPPELVGPVWAFAQLPDLLTDHYVAVGARVPVMARFPLTEGGS